ncbi:SNF2-related protein [Treponema sp. R6D11]
MNIEPAEVAGDRFGDFGELKNGKFEKPKKDKVKLYGVENTTEIIVSWSSNDKNEWKKVLDFIRRIPGRRYNNNTKRWHIDKSRNARDILTAYGFRIDVVKERVDAFTSVTNWKHLYPFLRSYQVEDLKFLESRGGRGLIADEMGLGKTCVSLVYADKLKPVTLCIVRATTKNQWASQIEKFTTFKNVYICNGQTAHRVDADIYIINWDILVHWVGNGGKFMGSSRPIELVISDECQALANMKSQRTKAWIALMRNVKWSIPMSGTPCTSNPVQFFAVLNNLEPKKFWNQWQYMKRYCNPRFNGFGMVYEGLSNAGEFKELIAPLFIRHLKKDWLKELPEKVYNVVELDVKIDKAENERIVELLENNGDIVNANTLFLWQQKRKEAMNYITDWLDDNPEEKLVLFCWYRNVVDELGLLLQKYGTIKFYGGSERDGVEQFIADKKKRVFVANMVSGGVGIDGLQNVCSNAFFVELRMVPASHLQAEDRLHRLGQSGSVNITYLIAREGVERRMCKMLNKRLETLGEMFDEKRNEFAMLEKPKQLAFNFSKGNTPLK